MKFDDKIKVYFSGSIKGTPEPDLEFAWKLVRYMDEIGVDVLSEHVAGRNREEMDSVFAIRTGKTIEELQKDSEPWFGIRKQDMEWVDEATHVVALVNAPSFGVGMELQRALENKTPILCLVSEDSFSKLSYMIRGITQEYFLLKTYKNLDEAKAHIYSFLNKL